MQVCCFKIDQIMQHKLNRVLLGITKPQEIEICERKMNSGALEDVMLRFNELH